MRRAGGRPHSRRGRPSRWRTASSTGAPAARGGVSSPEGGALGSAGLSALTSAEPSKVGRRAVSNRRRNEPSRPTTRQSVMTRYRVTRLTSKRTAPAIAALPSRPTVTVCTAASSEPNRGLITPVARNSWNVSAGIRNRSSRNGTAAFRLPKNVSSPVSGESRVRRARDGGVGEPAGEQDEAERQQLAGVREVERRRHDHVGQRRRVRASRWRRAAPAAPCRPRSALGSTMKRSPAMNAVMQRVARRRRAPRRYRIGVSAATSPGSTHSATSSAMAT